jgi:hypothetical protein
MRVANKMPNVDLKDAIDTFRWEFATDNYFYGIDLARPWDVTVMRRIIGDDWIEVDPKELMAACEDAIVSTKREIAVRDIDGDFRSEWAESPKWMTPKITHEEIEEHQVAPEGEEEFEAAAVIAMSQGMAALKVEEPGPFWPEGHYDHGMVDAITVPNIYTTREELFRHG